jgi:very-short-patch-repair endonuclease
VAAVTRRKNRPIELGAGVVRLWEDLPIGRVVRLTGGSPAALALTLVPLPDSAPTIVTWRPRAVSSQSSAVTAALDELETVAIGLFPAWLPGAEGIDGPGGANVAAVRELAARTASSTSHFGPYLAGLAERALRGSTAPTGRFLPQVKAPGVARVLAASFARPAAALLVEVPEGLSGEAAQDLVAGCEWLAHHGALGVWLTGAPLVGVDRLTTVPVRMPDEVASLERAIPPSPRPAALPTVTYPPLAGRPHPASAAERLLESALAQRRWAAGRAWNQTYQSHPLANLIRVDLVWWRERCVVEIDGPEHRDPLQFEADRRRDVQLQLHGYAVLRFTNAQVIRDVEAVVAQIEHLIRERRPGASEGRHYARQQ